MKVIKNVSEQDKEIFKFFSSYQPCWFEGCEEMKKNYQADLDTNGGESCPSCTRGQIIRRYVPLIKKALGYE